MNMFLYTLIRLCLPVILHFQTYFLLNLFYSDARLRFPQLFLNVSDASQILPVVSKSVKVISPSFVRAIPTSWTVLKLSLYYDSCPSLLVHLNSNPKTITLIKMAWICISSISTRDRNLCDPQTVDLSPGVHAYDFMSIETTATGI